MLRVTNGMMVNNLKRTMSSNMLSMAELQLQLASGKKINKPSDDPAGIVKSLRIRSNLTESEQYRTNINEASGFMQTADDALNSVTDIIHRIKELTVKAATGTNSAASEEAIAREIEELNEQLKVVANTKYGDKYIFSGTNTTQAPSQGNAWKGNEELMKLEIGVGVTIPFNLQMKDYFAGSLGNTNIETSSGIQSMDAQHLQEGEYTIKTKLGSPTNSTATAAQSYLGSISNNGYFFYSDASTAATLNAGTTTNTNNSAYNSSLMIEVKEVRTSVPADEPAASISGTAAIPVLTFDRTLYSKDEIQTLGSGNVQGSFGYLQAAGSTADLGGASYDSATKALSFTVSGVPVAGDTIVWNDNTSIVSSSGKGYEPLKAIFDGANWVYNNEPAAGTSGTAAAPVLTFDQGLYTCNKRRELVSNDLQANFTYTQSTGSVASLDAAVYDSTTKAVTFTITGTPVIGDTIVWNNKESVLSAEGKEYKPVTAIFDGTNWVYDDAAKAVATIKGHVYNTEGEYKYIELDNVKLNMEAGSGQAIFKIPNTAFNNPNGTQDLDFSTDLADLVIYNMGSALDGINPENPQLKVGDKTIINTMAQGDGISTEQIDIGCNYVDQYDKEMGEKTHSFAFADDYFDYQTRELKFFTMNEQIGVTYNGSIELTSHGFATSDSFIKGDGSSPTSFKYKAGLFDFVSDLANKVRIGKLPQVGNELEGQDERLQDLLMYRSTVGARINRLELQTNRLTTTEESLTKLLASTEDADLAKILMDLQLQENVYQASLAAGARIIQPSLVDFL